MRFRTDIAGLRAVAVLPILLLHAGIRQIPGGFIGVDIFFVISGYLITAILMRDMDAGRFHIAEFYRRRAVRILPALMAMLAVTLVAGILILFPQDLRQLGQHTAATAAFGSNILFWRTSSYFEQTAELQPLMHTWSLGVEEQFYIFYPLLLLLVRRFAPRHLKWVLILVAIGSAALALVMARSSPMAAFFLLPCRAWELSLGGLAAIGAFPALSSKGLRSGAALAGMAMIVAGFFAIDAESTFPFPWGMLPCVGTALLIAYGEDAPTAKFLGWAPMRGIGAISYSLYLWHWPILALWRFRTGLELAALDTAVIIALSFVLATASYWWIERPFLNRYHDAKARPVLIGAVVAIVAMAGIGLTVSRYAERLHPIPADIAKVASYGTYTSTEEYRYQFRPGTCFSTIDATGWTPETCLKWDPARKNVLLVGDSLAAHLWRAMSERHPDANIMQATGAVCHPYFGSDGMPRCIDVLTGALQMALDRKPDRVVIAGRWLNGNVDLLLKTVRQLRDKGIPVTVIGPPADYSEPFPRLLSRAMGANDFNIVAKAESKQVAILDRSMRASVTALGADFVSIYDVQCPAGRCRLFASPGVPMLTDERHLSLAGARVVVAQQPIF